jgi:hypothetical protein
VGFVKKQFAPGFNETTIRTIRVAGAMIYPSPTVRVSQHLLYSETVTTQLPYKESSGKLHCRRDFPFLLNRIPSAYEM